MAISLAGSCSLSLARETRGGRGQVAWWTQVRATVIGLVLTAKPLAALAGNRNVRPG